MIVGIFFSPVTYFNVEVASADSPGTNYYVSSSTGDDSNPGTEAEPWKTIGKVNNELNGGVIEQGDDIYFKRGDNFSYAGRLYPRLGGTSSDPMIIGAYESGAKPILCNTQSGSNGKTIQGTYAGGTGHYIFENLKLNKSYIHFQLNLAIFWYLLPYNYEQKINYLLY